MNEATADNNGVYLLDGRHGNGCRQKERERERARGIISTALHSVDPLYPLALQTSCIKTDGWTSASPHSHRNYFTSSEPFSLGARCCEFL